MAETNPHLDTLRCPVCFGREVDVVMLKRADQRHYCPRCSFFGDESEVRGMYRDEQKKFKWMTRRLTLEQQRAL